MVAADIPATYHTYKYMYMLAIWVDSALHAVLEQLLYDNYGSVTMKQWADFQTALLLLMVAPLIMPPTRVSILATLRHPDFFDTDAHPCTIEPGCKELKCQGNRVLQPPNSCQWVIRAGHHKTFTTKGVLVTPIPVGLAALLACYAAATSVGSPAMLSRKAGVITMFYSLYNFASFDAKLLSKALVEKLGMLCAHAGLPAVTVRGLRHMFATSMSGYLACKGSNMPVHLRQLQARAAEMMGSSLEKFKVGQ